MLKDPFAVTLVAAGATPARTSVADPWNGTWTLYRARSSAAARGGSAGLSLHAGLRRREHLQAPSRREVVTGHVDGKPVAICRARLTRLSRSS